MSSSQNPEIGPTKWAAQLSEHLSENVFGHPQNFAFLLIVWHGKHNSRRQASAIDKVLFKYDQISRLISFENSNRNSMLNLYLGPVAHGTAFFCHSRWGLVTSIVIEIWFLGEDPVVHGPWRKTHRRPKMVVSSDPTQCRA